MPLDISRTRMLRLELGARQEALALARDRSADARRRRNRSPRCTRIQRGSTATSAMKQTCSISSSRCVRGSRPSTFSSPSKSVRPRIAFSAVVLPAPLGPIRPTMRPGCDLEADVVQRQLVAVALASGRGRVMTALMFGSSVAGARLRAAASCRSRPRRCRRANSAGHSSRRKRSRSDFSSCLARAFGDVHAQSPPFFHELLRRPVPGTPCETVIGLSW